MLKAPMGRWWVGHINIKGVTVRFGFDVLRISQVLKSVENKATGNAPGDVCIHQFALWAVPCRPDVNICIGVGLSALLVSDGLGNARAFRTWNGQQDWLHAFFILCLTLWIYCLQEPKARYVFRLW